jgi:hypothetical protein
MTVAPMHHRAPHRFELVLAVLLVLVVAGAAVLLFRHGSFNGSSSSTVQGSGEAASETRNLAAFSSVELAGSNTVAINVGARQRVVVHADDNLLVRVTTRVLAGHLVIGNTGGSFTTRSPMRVDVDVPSLDSLRLTGSGLITATGIKATNLTVTLLGSGVVRASGITTRLVVTLAGSGDAQLDQLAAGDVQAVVSGSGRILVHPIKSLDASIPGSGTIVYTGNPAQLTSHVTGSGTVEGG